MGDLDRELARVMRINANPRTSFDVGTWAPHVDCSFCHARHGRCVYVTNERVPMFTAICEACAEEIGAAVDT